MANLKEVRGRIVSVNSTQQITKAMKMVSASKLRKAQTAIVQIRPYTNKLEEIIQNLQANVEGDMELSLGVVRPVQNVLIVLITSDKGLCGGYNQYLIKQARILIKEKYVAQAEAGKITVLCIGKKGAEAAQKFGVKVDTRFVDTFTKLSFENVGLIANEFIGAFENKQFDAVEVVYSEFKNAVIQNFKSQTLLPLQDLPVNKSVSKIKADYIFEPDMKTIIEYIIPTYIKIQFYRFILDCNASEHGARMTAMDKATENASELLRNLRLQYNRARQAAITTEISEIVGGVVALEG